MEGTKQPHRPESFRIRYKVLEAMSSMAPEQIELVDMALRRLEQGEETLWRSIWYPDLHYVFLESKVPSSDLVATITLSVEIHDAGLSIEVTDLLGT